MKKSSVKISTSDMKWDYFVARRDRNQEMERKIYSPKYMHKYFEPFIMELAFLKNAEYVQEALEAGVFGLFGPMTQLVLFDLPMISNIDRHVCLVGEIGTGKQLIAEYLHTHGPEHRRSKTLEPFNASSYIGSPMELEKELYGFSEHVDPDMGPRRGLLDFINEGTVYFDEVAQIPLPQQAKLLSVFKSEKEKRMAFQRVGEIEERFTNFRGIFAFNEDPHKLIKGNRLLKDLYYHISSNEIRIPPLRERYTTTLKGQRISDIEILIEYFIQRYMSEKNIELDAIEVPKFWFDRLSRYTYPGNVRELKTIIYKILDVAFFKYQTTLDIFRLYEKEGIGSQPSEADIIKGGKSLFKDLATSINIEKALASDSTDIESSSGEILQKIDADILKYGDTDHENYDKLTLHHFRRMIEKYGTQDKAAEAMGISRQRIHRAFKKERLQQEQKEENQG